MGLRDKLFELLSRGTPPDLDEDELVFLEEIPLVNGPMTVEQLKDVGIEAVLIESFDPVTMARSNAEIRVPRRQLAEANELLDTLSH